MSDDLVTVGQYTMPQDAHLARVELESHGIDAFVRDEFIIVADPLYSNAIGGVRLDVPEEDAERAREILGAHEPPSRLQAICPKCGSREVERKGPPLLPLVLAMLVNWLFALFFSIKFRCRSCGHMFKEAAIDESEAETSK